MRTVQAAFDAGRFVRTHVLRPTWHFVAAEDLRWMPAVTAPRVHQANAGRCRRQGLDQADLDRGAAVIADALAGAELTRTELAERLGDAGLPTERLDVVLLIMNAELEPVVGQRSDARRRSTRTPSLDDRVPAEPRTPADPTRSCCGVSSPATARPACATSPGGPR